MTPWIFIVPEWYLVTLSPQSSSNSWGFFAVLLTHLLCHLYWTAPPLHFVSILPPLFIIHHDDTQNVLTFLIILASEKSVKQCTFTGISPDIPEKIFCTLKWRNRLFCHSVFCLLKSMRVSGTMAKMLEILARSLGIVVNHFTKIQVCAFSSLSPPVDKS